MTLIQKKKTIMTAIDLGSYSLKMKIVEIGEEGSVKVLENLSKPASLGSDVFSLGKVNYDTVMEICDIIIGFKKIMSEYGSKRYTAVATSAIREAENRDQLIDLIMLKTGIKVEVLNNAREKFLTYKAIRGNLPGYDKLYHEGVMLVEVGSGNVEVTLYQKGYLLLTHSVKLGHLRLRKLLADLENSSPDFPALLDEYVESHIDVLKSIKKSYKINNFIALGSEMKMISKLCNNRSDLKSLQKIDINKFNSFYQEIITKPTPLLIREYKLQSDLASTLLPSMVILRKFLQFTGAGQIHTPLLSLNDGLVADFVNKRFKTRYHEDFDLDILKQSRTMAKKFDADLDHADKVEKNALVLFDALRQSHGMKKNDRLLLRIAAILHDTGKYVNLESHYEKSFELIKGFGILGLLEEELNIVANVARYHSAQSSYNINDSLTSQAGENRVITAKLVAIIRLADALDGSHKQKIRNLKVDLRDKEMIVRAESGVNTLLEEWCFANNATFFQEVFGVTPIIKVKRKIESNEQKGLQTKSSTYSDTISAVSSPS